MITLAYFIVPRSARLDGPLLWIANILIFAILLVLLWYIIKWVASEFGVPEKIVRLVGLLIFVFAVIALLTGCAGSGEGGAWTPNDTKTVIGAIDEGVDTYRNARAAYYGQAYSPPVVVAPQPYP